MASAEVSWNAPTTEPDQRLVERVLSGDEAAFALLYSRYFNRIYHYLEKRLHNRADTEETVQEVFFNVFSSIESYRGEAPFVAWVFGLTRRTLARRFKRKRHAMVPLADDEIGRREAARDRIALCELLAVVQIFGKWRRAVPLGAGNVGTDIREQSTADGGGHPTTKLDDPQPRQQIH